jgi:hypothetical protein
MQEDKMNYSFSGAEAVQYLKNNLFDYFKKAGLNPHITEEWKKGIFDLFNIKVISLPDLDKQNYLILSNHLSDFDAIILGLLHPKIRIVAKIGWATNKELMDFLSLHYNIVGIFRDSEIEKLNGEERKEAEEHNIKININSYKYLKNTGHLLVFPQGTISDINKNSKERVNPSFARIAAATKKSVINIFLEYPGTDGETRIICGEPYEITGRNLDYRQVWLDNIIALQNKLDNVRKPVLSEKHSLNNKPGEPFFT